MNASRIGSPARLGDLRPPSAQNTKPKPPAGLAKNFAFLSIGEAVSKIFTFISFTYLGRNFGPATYGEVEFSLSVILVFALSLGMGMGSYGTREIARRPEDAHRLLGELIEVRLWLVLAAVTLVLTLTWFIDKPMEVKLLLTAFAVSLLAIPAGTLWFFQAHDAMHWVASVNLTKHILFTALVLGFVRPNTPLWSVGVIETVSFATASILGHILIQRRLGYPRPQFQFSFSRSVEHMRAALPIGLADLAWSALWQAPMIVLGLRISDDSLGWFGAAHRCTMALHTFVWWYFFNLLPAVSRTVNEPRESLSALLAPSIKIAAWGGVFVALTGGLASSVVLQLAYGAEFAPGGTVLAILLWSLPLAALCGHYRAALIGYGLQQDLLVRTLVAAAVGASLAYFVSPMYGAAAAAVALVAGNFVLLELCFALTRRQVVDLSYRIPAMVPALAAGLAIVFSRTGGWERDLTAVALFSTWMLWANREQARVWIGRLRFG